MIKKTERNWLENYLLGSLQSISSLLVDYNSIFRVADLIEKTIKSNGTVYWMGNGGSAADAMHLSCELSSKFEIERKKFKSIPLTTNNSHITATGNDYNFKYIFSSQIEAYCTENDLIIGLSTSGISENIIEAFHVASKLKIKTVLLTGNHDINKKIDLIFKIDSKRPGNIQEGMLVAGQAICGIVELRMKDYFDNFRK